MNRSKTLTFILLIALVFLVSLSAAEPNLVELTKVTDDLWVHTSTQLYNGYPVPSNGLIVITKQGIVLIDTAWTEDQTRSLLKNVSDRFKQPIVEAVITHAHADRIGGIRVLLEAKIPVKSTALTAELAEKQGFLKPNSILNGMDKWTIGGTRIEAYYPGPGHTRDNIVVWLPDEKLLFAGCIVKSMDATNMGNTADADLKAWPDSLRKLLKRYPDAKIVIPGHGGWGGPELIRHTLDLLGK